jgi:hypothetical protein
LTIFLPYLFFFYSNSIAQGAEKRPKEGGWGGGGKKEGEGSRLGPAFFHPTGRQDDRKADLFFRSLFGFAAGEFGIAAIFLLIIPLFFIKIKRSNHSAGD